MLKFNKDKTLLVMDWDRTISKYDSSSYALLKNFVVGKDRQVFLKEMNNLTDTFFSSDQSKKSAVTYYKESFDLIRKYDIQSKFSKDIFLKEKHIKKGGEVLLNSNYKKVIYSAGIVEVIESIINTVEVKNILKIYSNTITTKESNVVTHLDKTGNHIDQSIVSAFSKFIVIGDTPSDSSLLSDFGISPESIISIGIWNKQGHHTEEEMKECFEYVFESNDDLYKLNRFLGI